MDGIDELIGIEFFFRRTEMLTTFMIIVLGLAFGNLKIKGVGFGASGVLIVAMAAGYLYQFEPIRILADFGIVLFLLSVGLEAGPSFFRAFKKHGKRFITNVLALLVVAGLTVVTIISLSGIPVGIGLGLFAGSFTSSPALVSALQFSSEKEVIFGYGVAYPFGLIGVIIFITVATKLLRKTMLKEVNARSSLFTAVYKVLNEDINGRLLRNIALLQDRDVVISGILRDLSVRTASGSTALFTGDVVKLEGTQEAVETAGAELGEPIHDEFNAESELDTRSIVVENIAVVNRTINDLGIRLRYNVSITRIIRSDVEFVARDDLTIEHGDVVVAVGTAYQLDQLELFLGHKHHTVQPKVDIASLAATLFLAFAIGGVVIPIPQLGPFSLGLAGGALISGLIFGHFGRIGNFIGRFPRNATSVLKELGLALFFVQIGFETGQSFVESLDFQVVYYATFAVMMAVIPMAASFVFGHFFLKISVSECFGVICGGMTFTPGLNVIAETDASERPVVAYSSVYPVALILVIALVQAMYVSVIALQGG